MKNSDYDPDEIRFLEKGFSEGFDIRYRGPIERQSTAKNLPLKVGSKTELWNKIIKEVKAKRVAGPYDSVPFENFIQSPIGLVPKSGNTGQTRLIFHLSYDFGENDEEKSLNYHTDRDQCSVHYNDLDKAVELCLQVKQEGMVKFDEIAQTNAHNPTYPTGQGNFPIFMGKSDVKSAFRLIPLSIWSWAWLIMSAMDPVSKKWKFFVDKCLPFGASISCAIFQRFSDAIKHITQYRTSRRSLSNYLDNFLFLAYTRQLCNQMIKGFLKVCDEIGVPIAMEKTEWATVRLVFLGILLDGERLILAIPEEKRT